jgi:hypothetical protein
VRARRPLVKTWTQLPVRNGRRPARGGGIGVIDRGFRPGEIQPSVKEVTAIKRTQHGIISDPHTILLTLCEALAKMEDTRVGILVVVDSRSASRWTLYAMAPLALGEPLRGVDPHAA